MSNFLALIDGNDLEGYRSSNSMPKGKTRYRADDRLKYCEECECVWEKDKKILYYFEKLRKFDKKTETCPRCNDNLEGLIIKAW